MNPWAHGNLNVGVVCIFRFGDDVPTGPWNLNVGDDVPTGPCNFNVGKEMSQRHFCLEHLAPRGGSRSYKLEIGPGRGGTPSEVKY